METKIKLAVQKSGRLSEKSLQIIEDCGISYSRYKSKLKAAAYNFPLELLYLRDDDIPKYVASGVADVGIVGENVLAEKNEHVEIVEKMGFSKCRLSIAVADTYAYKSSKDLNGLRIATSYPRLTQEFLDREGISAEIHEISGSVEIAPSIGLASAVCDLVSTGSTLLSNGLKEVETIFKSEAVMIRNPKMDQAELEILDDLMFRIRSVLRAKRHKYILMNIPNESVETICAILPGMRSPTVVPLATEGWSSLHTVVQEDDFWSVIDKVRQAGAEGILVSAIEKMVL